MRPTWDRIWMELATRLAERSTCSRAQVGCVVTSFDNTQVLANGYNGGPRGGFNECKSLEPGKCGHLHAEINAMIKLNPNAPGYKRLYTTTFPCGPCSVAIVNAGISEVIYLNDYRSDEGIETLQQAKIPFRKFEE